jgi:hypothetical protein
MGGVGMNIHASRRHVVSAFVVLSILWLVAAGCGETEVRPAIEASCGEGTTRCAGECVSIRASHAHCGECDHPCELDEVCNAGVCSRSCGPDSTACDGSCTKLASDPQNCGACGTVCEEGLVCSDGACSLSCGTGTTRCGTSCVDVDVDAANCGFCNLACNAGEICSNGQCVLDCGPGFDECDGRCVDQEVDPDHCGACGERCDVGYSCVDGACEINCGPGTSNCGGTCVDTALDPSHCGGCDQPCAAGLVCSQSMCQLTCTGGTTKCGAVCVETDNDPDHCGGCGQACPAQQACVNGTCEPCVGGLTFCNGACVDTTTNTAHCGGCGMSCPTQYHADESCVAGVCEYDCQMDWGACTTTTCSTYLRWDESNCGACGNVCAFDEQCSSGTCESCPVGEVFCGSGCVDTETHTSHCGGCGNYCPYRPNTVRQCVSGVCSYSCYSGWLDCDMPSTNGCETNSGYDPQNCGGCGNACGPNEICDDGNCIACGGGTTLCNGSCVDTNIDPDNCGGCSITCTGAANAVATCSAGSCGFDCTAGWYDCDLNPNSGCEIPSSETDCAGCGDVCSAQEFCSVAGSCQTCSPSTLSGPLPIAVAGTTVGQDNDSVPPCHPSGHTAPDVLHSFTAPSAGTYTFTSTGFYNTLYVAADTCSGASMGCDWGYTSNVSVTLTAGQTVIIVVDGYTYHEGNYVLTVE